MNNIIIKGNQSALDMVLMACGTMEGAMQLMAANNASLSTNPPVNTEYIIPEQMTADKIALSYLKQNQVEIGTFSAAIE